MDDFRKSLEAVLLQFGFESPKQEPSDDELIQMVREMGEKMEAFEQELDSVL
jgi:hypothetical protein